MLKSSLDDLTHGGAVGDWCFMSDEHGVTYIVLRFPYPVDDGFENITILPVEGSERKWTWNGNREAPTLSPSILVHGSRAEWHGFLEDGKIRTI